MTIRIGAYRDRNPNAVFLMRDHSFVKSVPVALRDQFEETDREAVEKSRELKIRIKEAFPNQVLLSLILMILMNSLVGH